MGEFIEILKYILLGLVQGITEVLPISSSGHLIIVNEILNVEDNSIALSVFLHVASLLAILIYLRKELIELIVGFFGYIFKDRVKYKNSFFLALYLVVTTAILVIFTIVVKLLGFENSSLLSVGICLLINATMLLVLGKFTGRRPLSEMNFKDAIVVGLFQCAGSFAGISRSGSCLCGCEVQKIEKESSAKYAFLLFVPAIVGATVLELKDIGGMFKDPSNIYLYLISFFVSFAATYLTFHLLRKIINKGKLTVFSIYCYIMGAFVVIFSLVR